MTRYGAALFVIMVAAITWGRFPANTPADPNGIEWGVLLMQAVVAWFCVCFGGWILWMVITHIIETRRYAPEVARDTARSQAEWDGLMTQWLSTNSRRDPAGDRPQSTACRPGASPAGEEDQAA